MKFKNFNQWNKKIAPFSVNTRLELWTYPQTAKKMLEAHLGDDSLASRQPKNIKDSVNFMFDYFDLNKNKSVCDLGCGPGLYTELLAKKNINVTGIDFSENSINYAIKSAAKNKLKNVNYKLMDYMNFSDVNKYDLVTLIFCDYCAIEKEKRLKILKNAADSLKKGGHFFFDVMNKSVFNKEKAFKTWNYSSGDGFWFEEEYVELFEKILYHDEKITLSKHYISGVQGEKMIYNWSKFYSVDEIKEELSTVGFKIIDVFGDTTGAKYENTCDNLAIAAKL